MTVKSWADSGKPGTWVVEKTLVFFFFNANLINNTEPYIESDDKRSKQMLGAIFCIK